MDTNQNSKEMEDLAFFHPNRLDILQYQAWKHREFLHDFLIPGNYDRDSVYTRSFITLKV